MWDLLGCDYYWGMVPHLVSGFLFWFFRTNSIEVVRGFNILMGSLNAVLVFKVASLYYGWENGIVSSIGFAMFPFAVIFDSIAMQDTMALTLVLLSLYLMKSRCYWSGFFLGLAAHSRVEYTLVSILILGGFILRERLETNTQPYILGWLTSWGVFSLHIYFQTGNPVYPLYYSLYSVFGGYTSKFKGLPFSEVFMGWLGSRPYIWLSSVPGIAIIFVGLFGLFLIPYMAWRRWIRYEPLLYWVSALMTMGPLFLPYFDSERVYFLMMIRFLIPVVALGLPLLFDLLSRQGTTKKLGYVLLCVLLLGYPMVVPHYSGLQAMVLREFDIADQVGEIYVNGTVICDHPSMIYRLVQEWGVEPCNLLSNHYGPHYYGITEPSAYLAWLDREQVSIWMYIGDRGEPVYRMLMEHFEGVLKYAFGHPKAGCYIVDQGLIDSVL